MVSDREGGGMSQEAPSLNPCSNGIWSLTEHLIISMNNGEGLNPCSNGIWSLTNCLARMISAALS